MADKSFWSDKKDREWLKNFVYYYKVHMLIIAFFVLAIISTAITLINKINYDLSVSYIGSQKIMDQQLEKFSENYSKYLTDIDKKDGVQIYYYNLNTVFKTQGVQNDMAIQQEIMIQASEYGDTYLYILDSASYARFSDFLIYDDISDITGNKEDPYGFCINQSPKICNLLGIDENSKSHYIAIRKIFDTENEKEALKHENARKLLKSVIEGK